MEEIHTENMIGVAEKLREVLQWSGLTWQGPLYISIAIE